MKSTKEIQEIKETNQTNIEPVEQYTNAEKITASIEKIGNYFKEIKESQKNSLKMTIIYFAVIIIIIAGVYVYGIVRGGGLNGIMDTNAPLRKFDCTNGQFNDTVRTYYDAKTFVEVFGGNCSLRLSR